MNKKRLQFHLETNDYFGTLATVLDLMRQTTNREGYTEENNDLLKRLCNDLVYLQGHYEIAPKDTNKKF